MKIKTIFGAIVPITVATLMGTSAMGMDLSALLGGGDENPGLSISAILMTEHPKDKKKLIMDGYSDEKQYVRINGEEKTIISFSVETSIVDTKSNKKNRSHPSNPSLSNYDSAADMVNYVRKAFEEQFLSHDLIKFKTTKVRYHEANLGTDKLNDFGKRKRDVISPYSDMELHEMANVKKVKLDFEFDRLSALNIAMRTKDFDISTVFSYFDRQRELKIRLSIDRTQEKIDALPKQAEKIHEDVNDFFNDLGEWLELTMDAKKDLIAAYRIPENGMYG